MLINSAVAPPLIYTPSTLTPPGKGARTTDLSAEEVLAVRGLGLLTLKPLIYAANVGEDDLGNQGVDNKHVQARTTASEGAEGVRTCACARPRPQLARLSRRQGRPQRRWHVPTPRWRRRRRRRP